MKMKVIKQSIKWVQDLKIRNKIVLFYMTLIVVSILLSMFIYNITNTYYLNEKITELTISEIESNNRSLELLVEEINNYSKFLIGNQTIQKILNDESGTMTSYKTLDKELNDFINLSNMVSSIYIFKNDGKKYYTEKIRLKDIHLEDIQKMPWYQQVMDKKGGYVLNINGDGLLESGSDNYVTFFRIINSLDSLQPIGLIMINVRQEVIQETLGLQKQKEAMFVIDFENSDIQKTLTFNAIEGFNQKPYINALHQENQLWDTEKLYNTQMVVTGYKNEKYGWKLLRVTPFNGQVTQMNIFKVAILVIIVLNGFLVFLGSFFVSRFITNPINKLIGSMKEVQKGNFYPVEVETHNDEIGLLKNGYNFMIKEIQKLIQEIIKDQKTLKNAEFSVLMEQIKPHFLYNTIDSISSLVMLKRTDEAYKSLRALGSFYRTSLSDGRNMVTVDTEIEITKNYLFIQKIRYEDLFNVTYDIDVEVLEYKVPKLILQPLVENSIYHGIRPLGEEGLIEIFVKKEHAYVVLIVRDNGIGMSQEKIDSLNNSSDKSVGVPATRERIRTLYGNKSEFIIENNKEGGIKITIKLPWEAEILDDKKLAKSINRR